MGYCIPKKPFDLKEFLSEKAQPRRGGWSYRASGMVRKPSFPATPSDPAAESEPDKTDPDKTTASDADQ